MKLLPEMKQAKNTGNIILISEEFNVYDLNGLVRIIAPKDQILPQENMDYDSQAYIMDRRTDKIARYIYVSDKEKIPKNFYLKKLIAVFIFVTE